jgi:hypothetical protein
VRAAGIALKLDPQSQWLREIDQQTLQQARPVGRSESLAGEGFAAHAGEVESGLR